MSKLPPISVADKARFDAEVLPLVERKARFAFRHLRCPGRFDDAVANAVANAWGDYCKLVRSGRIRAITPHMIAYWAVSVAKRGYCRPAGSRSGRRVAFEPLDWKVQGRYDFKVHCVGDDASGKWQEVLRDGKPGNVADTVAFRIDFSNWLATRSERERAEIAELASGTNAWQASKKLKVSAVALGEHRKKWRESWARFIRK